MDKTKKFLILQSAVYILAVIMLASAAYGIYRDGKARKAEDPTAYIYTREGALNAAAPGVKVLLVGIGLSIAGWVLGIRDEEADKPVLVFLAMKEKKQGITESISGRIRLTIFVLSLIFIAAGILNGNMRAVLVKAINICTECIGLG